MARALTVLALLLFAPAAQAAVPAVQAHRGGPVLAGVPTFPEETMPAFRNAAEELGVVLELDAKLTKDGVPVVIHDATLDRTTNCTGAVVEKTLPVFFPEGDRPFGYQDPGQWRVYGDWMFENKLLDKPPTAEDALTNEFLPGQGLEQPRTDY